jgi:hypothetical protein
MMARSVPSGGGSSVTEATTLIFPKKSVWEDLAKTKRETKKRAQSQSGIYGAAVKEAVEKEHVDRKALAIVLKLDAMDDEDLHVTMFHLIDGLKKLGILTRAMAQEEMFDEHRTDDGALDDGPSAPKGKKSEAKAKAKPNGRGKKGDNVVHIGDAARSVAEQAGAD